MVRPPDAPPPGAHLTKGQKKNKKKIACIGAVDSVDRHMRTPEELVQTLFRAEDRPRLTPNGTHFVIRRLSGKALAAGSLLGNSTPSHRRLAPNGTDFRPSAGTR